MALILSEEIGTRRLAPMAFAAVVLASTLFSSDAYAGVIFAKSESSASAALDFVVTNNDAVPSNVRSSVSGSDETGNLDEAQADKLQVVVCPPTLAQTRGGASSPPRPVNGSAFPIVAIFSAAVQSEHPVVCVAGRWRELRVHSLRPHSLQLLDPPRIYES